MYNRKEPLQATIAIVKIGIRNAASIASMDMEVSNLRGSLNKIH